MLTHFLKEIEDKYLFSKADRLLVAVSGGVDSMVLTHLLQAAGYDFAVAHCNFKLRGTQSDEDEKFVFDSVRSMGMEYFTTSFATNNYATEKGISIQMAARELRYAWFDRLMREHSFHKLVTAHHANDALETVLFNLIKGTGLRGLRGIMPKHGKTVRPLLSFTKDQILAYAQAQRVKWREDASNASNKYSRNLIRNEVVPLLQQVNPGLLATFLSTQKRLIATEDLLKNTLEELALRHTQQVGEDWVITFDKVYNLVFIEFVIAPFGFNLDQAVDIQQALTKGHVGGKHLSGGYQLNVDRNQLIISPFHQTPRETSVSVAAREVANDWFSLRITLKPGVQSPTRDARQASIDFDKLQFPLTIRKWRTGDYFYPLGMQGKKKISDFMIDNKIPLNLKERVCVLTSGGDIAWVIGHRLDDRFKITKETKCVYQIELTEDDQSI